MIQRIFICALLFMTVMHVFARDNDSNDQELAKTLSYNDQGVKFIESGSTWEAIRAFERAIRSGGHQKRVASANVSQFRREKDLPAHTILHFGWLYGIGRIAGFVSPNFWLVISIGCLLLLVIMYFIPSRWSLNRMAALFILASVCLGLGMCQAAYINSEDLIIFKSDADLKDKPYDFSGDKQVVFEGQMARIEQVYENYYQVQTDTYETGWVLKEEVTPVW